MPVYHPNVVFPRLLLFAPLLALLRGVFTVGRVWKYQVRRVEEIAYPRWTVRDEGEDLGDEGLLDERRERGVELGQPWFA